MAYWLRLGLISFGGPAGQIAMMQSELVDRRGWIDQRRFLNALNFCMLLPGPEAQQLATYVGWRLHGVRGGLAAGVLFVLPGALVLWALAYVAAAHGGVPIVAAVFEGIKPVVVAIILAALLRIGRRTLTGWLPACLALAAFAAIQGFGVAFPIIVLVAALIGLAAERLGLASLAGTSDAAAPAPVRHRSRLVLLTAIFAALWALPVLGVIAWLGVEPFTDIAVLFTKAAFVTFGGAYAVLPYIADAAVNTYGWLSPDDMVRGLALAETTPGPLILVTQFVGFFAGWNAPGDLAPALAGGAAAWLTVYVTFLPCFLFIFAGAPYVERLGRNRFARAALVAVTAAVVGVILNLAVFLGRAVFVLADGSIDWRAGVMAATALFVLVRWNPGVHWVVLAGAVIGAATV